MLAYAASRPLVGKRQSSPNAMLIVIGVHVAVIAAFMSAKMDLPNPFHPDSTEITFIPIQPPPPAHPVEPPRMDHQILPPLQLPPRVAVSPMDNQTIDPGPTARSSSTD